MMNRTLTAAAALIAGASCLTAPAMAEPVPWNGAEVDLVARNRPIQDLVEELFQAEGLTVSFEATTDSKLNGEFTGSAERMFNRIASAYKLVPYYDGATVYIYGGSDVSSQMYDLGPERVEDVRRQINDLGMGDAKNTTRMTRDGVFIVSGVPTFRQAVDGVIRTRDVAQREPDNAMVTEVFPLKHAWAQDTTQRFGSSEVTIPGVATILRSLASGSSPVVHAQTEYRPLGVNRLNEVAGGRLGETDPRNPNNPYARSQEVALRDDIADPQQVQLSRELRPLSSDMSIEANPRTNAVIIRDRAGNMPNHRALIAELDTEAQIVAIEATIIDVDTNKARDFGTQWRLSGSNGRFDATQGGQITNGLPLNPGSIANPFAGGLLASGVIGGEDILSARFSALEAEGLAKVVSRPQIMTLANVEAVFNNTETFFPQVESDFDASLFEVTVGTILRVTPHIIDNDEGPDEVKLIVSVEDGRLRADNVGGLPVVARSGVNTQGVMQLGETLLFGGLTVDRSESFETGVPFLRSIPLVGKTLFGQKSSSKGRVERMFLLTPRLIQTGGNVAMRLDEPPAPIIGRPAPELRRAEPLPGPRLEPETDPRIDQRPGINEVSLQAAPAVAATSLGLEIEVERAVEVAPLLRGGQLFGARCDDLDPYTNCEDEA